MMSMPFAYGVEGHMLACMTSTCDRMEAQLGQCVIIVMTACRMMGLCGSRVHDCIQKQMKACMIENDDRMRSSRQLP